MKHAFMALSLMMSFSVFAESIENRINEIHPNESVDFSSPQYLGLPFISSADSGQKLCKYLGYKGLLAETRATSHSRSMAKGWYIYNNKLEISDFGEDVFTPRGYWIHTIRELRCLK